MPACQHVECTYDGPHVVVRVPRGGETHLSYCPKHDPLKDPRVADLWEQPGKEDRDVHASV